MSITVPAFYPSEVEIFRYVLSVNVYGISSEVPWIACLWRAVRKFCRSTVRRALRSALARLFQRRLEGEMRSMPVVQVHNKKEAQ